MKLLKNLKIKIPKKELLNNKYKKIAKLFSKIDLLVRNSNCVFRNLCFRAVVPNLL